MSKKPALLCSTRLNLALISFLGTVMFYALRSNLSFAIVCMVKSSTDLTISDAFGTLNKTTISKIKCNETSAVLKAFTSSENSNEPRVMGEFEWSKTKQGTILSAFFWGYISSQVLAGYLASRFGAKIIIFLAIVLSSLMTLISPISARFDVMAFVVIRIILGFSQGALMPAFSQLWSSWAPPMERGLLTGLSYAGAQIGNVIVMPLSGFLCHYGFDGGWPSIFYLLAIAGFVWSFLWYLFAADSPQKDPKISERERDYIVEALGEPTSKKSNAVPPFRAIFTSTAVWACFIGHFAGDWGAYSLATCLPMFLNDVLGLNLTSMGIISSAPYMAYFIMINVSGYVADHLQSSGRLTTLNTRRWAMIIALGGQALFLNLIGYCHCGQELMVIILLILGIGISGLQYSGFVVNYLDICPAYAGTVVGIGNTLSCLAGILSPICTGWLTPTGSKEEWQHVFLLTGIILVVGAAFFVTFAKSEVQQWAHLTQPVEDLRLNKIHMKEFVAEPLITSKNVQ